MLCHISRRLRIRSVIRTREMNSLHSPMFPQPQQKFETEEAPRQKKESPDFLDAHGGKLILTVISTIGFFIYRWVKGGNNKLKVEDAVAHESPLHPYESHLFRSANSLSDEDFQHILQASRQKYPDGLISYEEFVRFIQENLPKSLSLTFYLDRVILFYLETIHQTSSNKVPLSIFLIALSNALQSSPQDRSELLFDVSQTMTSTEVQFLNNSPTPSSEDSLTTHSTPISSDYDPSLYCSLTHVKSLVNMLDIAWQVRSSHHPLPPPYRPPPSRSPMRRE
jgi:hypothetical protein